MLKEFAEDKFKFDENGKSSPKGQKTVQQEGHWPWGAQLRLMFCVQNTSKIGFDYHTFLPSKVNNSKTATAKIMTPS